MHCTKRILSCAAALFVLTATLASAAEPAKSKPVSEKDWWKNAVIYEIYPRSFQDSNGDGIGDINGITSRLDYLKQLGIDAIWLTPIYPSPQVDFGYDISDYEAIDPQYGTLADFDRLIAEANKRHIRVLMDMVMNHTSDKHKWFIDSRSSRKNPYRDWYVWKDGKGETATDKGVPPNNWQSVFGHTAWQWDPTTRQYWYHRFYTEQPDLNWNNPKVHQAFEDILAFWLKRGVGGFRFDAITALFEDPGFADDGVVKDKDGKPRINGFGEPELDSSKTDNLPGVHDVMAEMRASTAKFDTAKFPGTRVYIGETYLPNIAELAKQYGTVAKPEFHLPMDTQILGINKMDAATFRQKIDDVQTGIGDNIPMLVFDNHDNPRLDARYGDGVHDTDIQRVISTVLFATRGASLFYYGDEIGMKTTPPARKEDVKDPVGIIAWPVFKGRDGERTPMQWNATTNAGFSTAASTWLPVPPTYSTVNVQAQQSDPDSLFAWYQSLIQLKKTNPALARGQQAMLDSQNPKVLSWVRRVSGSPAVIVSANFTAEQQTVSLAAPGSESKVKTLLKTPGAADPATNGSIVLGPFGVYIGEIQP
jgi:alpha-glucosidase